MRLTDSEWQIMNALWRGHPATARDLEDRFPADVNWAYTTIKTLLSRLVAKGAVGESKRSHTSVYEPLVSRDEARRSFLQTFLDQAFDGAAAPLLTFLARDKSLTPKQRRQLAQILAEEDVRKREGK